MNLYAGGSEWRKWDLHVHAPGTRLNNQYGKPSEDTWERFCSYLEESDVAVIGITDYFTCDAFFEFRKEHRARHPRSRKVFLPNLELRLNEAVNNPGEHVHVHLLFRPDVTKEAVNALLSSLETECTDKDQRVVRCSDLRSEREIASATVSRHNIRKAILATFGESTPSDHVLVLVPAGNDGIDIESGKLRNRKLSDEIDKFADALFGGSKVSERYLKTDRYQNNETPSRPKPVFSGCDAHVFPRLESALGKHVADESCRSQVTWVKADPTFEGLQQTLVEPEHRVRIQPTRPDAKEPYKRIAKVRFSNADAFPQEVEVNENLVSVIGSRSSGKSALLAYIAHAIDPDRTIEQQLAVDKSRERQHMGPAAGWRWDDVGDICEVEWGDPTVQTGKVIYIPQNSLFAISGRPEEITSKIQPALYRRDPSFRTAHDTMRSTVDSANAEIRSAVEEWFRIYQHLASSRNELRELGDKAAIMSTRDTIAERIELLHATSTLTAEQTAQYQELMTQLGLKSNRRTAIGAEVADMSPYVAKTDDGEYAATDSVTVTIDTSPSLSALPDALRADLHQLIDESQRGLVDQMRAHLVAYRARLDVEDAELRADTQQLEADNQGLLAKLKEQGEFEGEVTKYRNQEDVLQTIEAKERHIQGLEEARTEQVTRLTTGLAKREEALESLQSEFHRVTRTTEDRRVSFGLERQFTDEVLKAIALPFNVRVNSVYIDRDAQSLKIDSVYDAPARFLAELADGSQKLKIGHEPQAAAVGVLTAEPDVRFFATLDDDRIGGFEQSTMTPGKQALFALTLILDESDDRWPLLIDQPEDDLDSRSVYETIVPYLIKQKAERQIIMGSHNANLVVGADTEQIIVAN